MGETYKLESKRGGSHAYRKQKTVITTAGEMPAAPKLNLLKGIKAIGGQCNNTCIHFPKGLAWSQGQQTYDEYNYCRRCRVYIPKTDLAATKQGAKILCPCCHAYTRRKRNRRPNR